MNGEIEKMERFDKRLDKMYRKLDLIEKCLHTSPPPEGEIMNDDLMEPLEDYLSDEYMNETNLRRMSVENLRVLQAMVNSKVDEIFQELDELTLRSD